MHDALHYCIESNFLVQPDCEYIVAGRSRRQFQADSAR